MATETQVAEYTSYVAWKSGHSEFLPMGTRTLEDARAAAERLWDTDPGISSIIVYEAGDLSDALGLWIR